MVKKTDSSSIVGRRMKELSTPETNQIQNGFQNFFLSVHCQKMIDISSLSTRTKAPFTPTSPTSLGRGSEDLPSLKTTPVSMQQPLARRMTGKDLFKQAFAALDRFEDERKYNNIDSPVCNDSEMEK